MRDVHPLHRTASARPLYSFIPSHCALLNEDVRDVHSGTVRSAHRRRGT